MPLCSSAANHNSSTGKLVSTLGKRMCLPGNIDDIKWSSYERNFYNSGLQRQFLQLRREIQDFNWVWTRDLAIPVRRSNQLSYEANDLGIWSSFSTQL